MDSVMWITLLTPCQPVRIAVDQTGASSGPRPSSDLVRALRSRGSFASVVRDRGEENRATEKAEHRAARELIGAYHQAQLRLLLERVRAGFAQLDAGEMDEFDLDELIHHYKGSAAALWTFCVSSGSKWLQAANALTYLREHGEEEPDWWERGAPRRSRAS